MALDTETQYVRGFRGRVDRHSDQSASGTALTVTVPIGEIRRLLYVAIKYSGASSTTVTVILNSGAGSSFDVLLASKALSAETDFVFIPDQKLIILADDLIDVLAPALSAKTSSITVYTEVL